MARVFPIRRRRWLAATVGAILLPLLSGPSAADDIEAERGLSIARTWCSSCHLVEPGGAAVDAGPPFTEVANDPERTPDRLRAWLADPHPPMPDLNLSRDEVRAILADLESLKAA